MQKGQGFSGSRQVEGSGQGSAFERRATRATCLVRAGSGRFGSRQRGLLCLYSGGRPSGRWHSCTGPSLGLGGEAKQIEGFTKFQARWSSGIRRASTVSACGLKAEGDFAMANLVFLHRCVIDEKCNGSD